ncbi:hypothetical protein VTN02DRAFT_3860 [Thermoascus thermophilus]
MDDRAGRREERLEMNLLRVHVSRISLLSTSKLPINLSSPKAHGRHLKDCLGWDDSGISALRLVDDSSQLHLPQQVACAVARSAVSPDPYVHPTPASRSKSGSAPTCFLVCASMSISESSRWTLWTRTVEDARSPTTGAWDWEAEDALSAATSAQCAFISRYKASDTPV